MRCRMCGRETNGRRTFYGLCLDCLSRYLNPIIETTTIDDRTSESFLQVENFVTADVLLKDANKDRIPTTTITLPRVEKINETEYELFMIDKQTNKLVHKILSGTEDEIIKQLKEAI